MVYTGRFGGSLFVQYFRMVMIIAAIRKNPESFDFLHEGLYKYMFYGIIFLMWVLWEEKFVNLRVEKSKLKKSDESVVP